jgi:surface antigen
MTFRLALLAVFLVLASQARAQINPWHTNRGPHLAPSDSALMNEAAQKLLAESPPANGTAETWQNEATGAAGKVSYLGPVSRTVRGTKYACRQLSYEVTLRNTKTSTTRAAWCHMPDGSWKLN